MLLEQAFRCLHSLVRLQGLFHEGEGVKDAVKGGFRAEPRKDVVVASEGRELCEGHQQLLLLLWLLGTHLPRLSLVLSVPRINVLQDTE